MAEKYDFRWRTQTGEVHLLVEFKVGFLGYKSEIFLDGNKAHSYKINQNPHEERLVLGVWQLILTTAYSNWNGKITSLDLSVNGLGVGKHVPGVALPFVDLPAASTGNVPSSIPRQASGPVVSGHVHHERIVERQVMVVRCKFCGQITPLDFNNCEKCGASSFS